MGRRSVQEQLEAAAIQWTQPRQERSAPYPAWVPRVYDIFCKIFDAQTFNREKEKRIKAALGHAMDEDAALEAIERVWNQNVRYPMGGAIRAAVDHVNLRRMQAQPYDPENPDDSDFVPPPKGPFVSFRDWFDSQDAAMQARVRRVFPSLKVEGPGGTA
jgi:hypothetical protein